MVPRPSYITWLQRWRGKDVVKVLTGLRRCGKSTLLTLFSQALAAEGIPDSNIISINFESLDEEYPTRARELYRYIVDRCTAGMNYVFLDEVQHVEDFQVAVDGLAVRDDVDVYITGSNAKLLSGELATLLTGRYVELRVLPLSFSELASAFPDSNPDDLFNRYLSYGGMPYLVRLDDEQAIHDYLGGVFNTVTMVDIAQRHPRIDMRAFSDTAAFLADNIGNVSSLKRISGGLKASGRAASPTTVGEYVAALLDNFLAFKASRYDIKGMEHLATLEKYYVGDLGFRFWLLGKNAGDVGHRLENAVYLELLRRYRSVFLGKIGNNEVDFVVLDNGKRRYYQVAATVLDEATLHRELRPLRSIKDSYPKTLLTLDRIGTGDFEGIEHVNALDWLLAGA